MKTACGFPTLPSPKPEPGVYLLLKKGAVVYVGQTGNVVLRLAAHARRTSPIGKIMWDDARYIAIANAAKRRRVEALLIRTLEPILNNTAAWPAQVLIRDQQIIRVIRQTAQHESRSANQQAMVLLREALAARNAAVR